jgi:hypothetical protein
MLATLPPLDGIVVTPAEIQLKNFTSVETDMLWRSSFSRNCKLPSVPPTSTSAVTAMIPAMVTSRSDAANASEPTFFTSDYA